MIYSFSCVGCVGRNAAVVCDLFILLVLCPASCEISCVNLRSPFNFCNVWIYFIYLFFTCSINRRLL